jgi:hypothetical protein
MIYPFLLKTLGLPIAGQCKLPTGSTSAFKIWHLTRSPAFPLASPFPMGTAYYPLYASQRFCAFPLPGMSSLASLPSHLSSLSRILYPTPTGSCLMTELCTQKEAACSREGWAFLGSMFIKHPMTIPVGSFK